MKFGFAFGLVFLVVLVIAAVQGAPQKNDKQPPLPKFSGFMNSLSKGLVAARQRGFNTDRKAACGGSSTPATTTTAAAE